MESDCPESTYLDFVPQKGEWTEVARKSIVDSAKGTLCLRGIHYKPGCYRFADDSRGYFRVDHVVFNLQWARWSIDALRIVPVGGVTLRMFLEMLKSIENAGHTILGASGFNDHSGDLIVPGKFHNRVGYSAFCSLPKRIKDDYMDLADCACASCQ